LKADSVPDRAAFYRATNGEAPSSKAASPWASKCKNPLETPHVHHSRLTRRWPSVSTPYGQWPGLLCPTAKRHRGIAKFDVCRWLILASLPKHLKGAPDFMLHRDVVVRTYDPFNEKRVVHQPGIVHRWLDLKHVGTLASQLQAPVYPPLVGASSDQVGSITWR
jgi:hypothetical protein